jgi:hypothetical protein
MLGPETSWSGLAPQVKKLLRLEKRPVFFRNLDFSVCLPVPQGKSTLNSEAEPILRNIREISEAKQTYELNLIFQKYSKDFCFLCLVRPEYRLVRPACANKYKRFGIVIFHFLFFCFVFCLVFFYIRASAGYDLLRARGWKFNSLLAHIVCCALLLCFVVVLCCCALCVCALFACALFVCAFFVCALFCFVFVCYIQ